jgi:Protein of unknown function (DUF2380)
MRPLLLIACAVPLIAAAPAPVAVFDVQFMNASLEPTTPAETARIAALTTQLRAALAKHYRLVDLPQNADPQCNGCALSLAEKAGAQQAAVAWVHKVSNIVLDLNLEIDEVPTGKRVAAGTVELKGNSDETWSRGLDYLLENRIFPEKPQ